MMLDGTLMAVAGFARALRLFPAHDKDDYRASGWFPRTAAPVSRSWSFDVSRRGKKTSCVRQPFPAKDEGYMNDHRRGDEHHRPSTPRTPNPSMSRRNIAN
jgi:hypothetical protein